MAVLGGGLILDQGLAGDMELPEFIQVFGWCGPGLGFQRQAHARQHGGVGLIGLGELSGGLGEASGLAGIDLAGRQTRPAERLFQGVMVASRGLEQDPGDRLAFDPVQARDVGDRSVLLEVGVAAWLDAARVTAMLGSDEGLAEVRDEIERSALLGVSGVPTVVVNGRPLFCGAIRPELIEAHLREAATHV